MFVALGAAEMLRIRRPGDSVTAVMAIVLGFLIVGLIMTISLMVFYHNQRRGRLLVEERNPGAVITTMGWSGLLLPSFVTSPALLEGANMKGFDVDVVLPISSIGYSLSAHRFLGTVLPLRTVRLRKPCHLPLKGSATTRERPLKRTPARSEDAFDDLDQQGIPGIQQTERGHLVAIRQMRRPRTGQSVAHPPSAPARPRRDVRRLLRPLLRHCHPPPTPSRCSPLSSLGRLLGGEPCR